MTANVWVRGMLEEEYGVKPSDIKWRRGGLEEPGREERAKIKLPPEIDLQAVPDDRTLSDMLAKGEIDGLLSARAPCCFLRGAPNVGRLFPDYPAVEEAYFKKTKLFPIMHAIGIRRSLVEKYPWLAVNVYKAFLKAKALCMHELGRDRPPARHAAVAGPRLRPGAQGHGRGLLALRRAREQAAAGNAGALFVRAGPVGAAGAARRDVRQADLRADEDLARVPPALITVPVMLSHVSLQTQSQYRQHLFAEWIMRSPQPCCCKRQNLQLFRRLHDHWYKSYACDLQARSPSRNDCQADLGGDKIDDGLLFLSDLRYVGTQARLLE